MSEKEIINKVAQSPLITFNLEDYLPPRMAELDLCTLVEDGMLREEAFRNTLKANDFSAYENAVVRLYLSEDLILPAWAPILLSSRLADLGIASIWAPNSEMGPHALERHHIETGKTYMVYDIGRSLLSNPAKNGTCPTNLAAFLMFVFMVRCFVCGFSEV